jgi:hypothetical protein
MTTENTTAPAETTAAKGKKFVLPKEARHMMVNALENAGDLDIDGQDDEIILKKYNQYVLGIEKKVNNYETSQETKGINEYLGKAQQSGEIKVQNKEFIMRLFRLNIPSFYLHLFKDDHAEISDRELWKVINKSGISPIKEVSQLTKMRRSPVKPKIL